MWKVQLPRSLEKTLRNLPQEVGRLLKALVTDFENEGPFPKGWRIESLHGEWKGYLKVRLKKQYRVIYRYESSVITIFIERLSHRKDIYGR